MSTERSIPHLRDVFGFNGYQTPYQHHAYPPPRHVDPYAQPQHPPPRMQPHPMSTPQHQYTPDNSYSQQSQLQQYQHNHNYDQQSPPAQSQHAAYPTVDLHAKTSTRKRRDNYKTLTSGDVKTLERHLSMKKTIRKKIMRDLQQAFVDDPNEFKVEHNNSDRLKSELNMEALRFGDNAGNASDNFLVMLRDDQLQQQQQHYRHNAPSAGVAGTTGNGAHSDEYSKYQGGSGATASREYDYDSATAASKGREEKPSFWKRFTFKNKTKA